MHISLNGQDADARGAQTVAELIGRFELSPDTILIEHNGVALHRREWPQKSITDGDKIEIIRVAAGG
ncbi:MAG TPA: sulfur carrier protein ThiS [Chthoniobacterales bacterium]|nr:sulfur carrier protein ThiS [Chthoniobacterales bacterium]